MCDCANAKAKLRGRANLHAFAQLATEPCEPSELAQNPPAGFEARKLQQILVHTIHEELVNVFKKRSRFVTLRRNRNLFPPQNFVV